MEPQHAQRKPRYALYFGLLALGVVAAVAEIIFSITYALGGFA